MTGVAATFQPNDGGNFSTLDIAAATVVKNTPGLLITVSVLVAGAVGAIYDSISTSGNTAENTIGVIPAVVGIYQFNSFPCFNGIVVAPGAAQVVSVSYS